MNLLRPWPGHSSPVADSSALPPPEFYAFSLVFVCLLAVKLTAVAAGPDPPDLRPPEPHAALLPVHLNVGIGLSVQGWKWRARPQRLYLAAMIRHCNTGRYFRLLNGQVIMKIP
jgi:hypothetical protein